MDILAQRRFIHGLGGRGAGRNTMSIDVRFTISLALLGGLCAMPAAATETPFFFNTGAPDKKIATASRPESAVGKFEIESADDFVLTKTTQIDSATFTGLLTGGATIGEVRVEIYHVFPTQSDVGRTSGPPMFSTPQVPTRVNSPSDVEFEDRDTASGNLGVDTRIIEPSFTVLNSVQPGGVHLPSPPAPPQGGDGPLTGEEVQFNVKFTTPFILPADHYFFVPQVEITDPTGNFFWLSVPRPIVDPGTPFPPGFTDLQEWTRDAALDPDWLRVGTDIVGKNADGVAPTFNAAFSLTGAVIPEPSTWAMMLLGFAGLGFAAWRKSRRATSIA
jgi:hypothetical protein